MIKKGEGGLPPFPVAASPCGPRVYFFAAPWIFIWKFLWQSRQ